MRRAADAAARGGKTPEYGLVVEKDLVKCAETMTYTAGMWKTAGDAAE